MNPRLRSSLLCLLVVGGLLAGAFAGCSDDSPSRSGVPADYTLLSGIDAFYIGGPDDSENVYPAVTAFRGLVKHAEADRWFKELSGADGEPAMIYGFAGMYFTDQDSLAQVIFDHFEDDRYLPVRAHGEVYSQKISDLAAQIAHGLLSVELNGGPPE